MSLFGNNPFYSAAENGAQVITENWSKGASSSYRSDKINAAKQRKKAETYYSIAKKFDKDSVEHKENMTKHHTAMAKSIKHSYHAAEYGSSPQAKRDYKGQMDMAKSYKG